MTAGIAAGNGIRTGYPVYKIEANQTGSKLIFYNTLNSYNDGIFGYDVQNETTVNINPGSIATAIGDCKYNQFTNEFLITMFHPDFAKIIRLNADNLTQTGEITIPNKQFAKEMFISPNGKLYVCTDMNSPNLPAIYVYNASNYNYLSAMNANNFDAYNTDFAYFAAHFSNNPFDTTVSVLLTVQEKKLLPYNSIASNIYGEEMPNPETPPGKLIVIDKSNIIEAEINISNYPVNIICPCSINQNINSQYVGKSYLIGKRFYEIDHTTPPTVTGNDTTGYDAPFIGITYDIANDMLFAVKETHADDCGEHRAFEIWAITYENKLLTFKKFNTDGMLHNGQIASIFYNKYDNRIYIYQKIDAKKLGTSQVNLLWFSVDNPVWDSTSLGIKSYFPDYDHTRDDSYYFINNNITPYIDPYQNKIYLPNGGHSNVSVVGFEANEQLTLNPVNNETNESFTWLSFPRLTSNNATPVNSVLGGDNIQPNQPPTIYYQEGSQLINLPLNSQTNTNFITNNYNYNNWSSTNGLNNCQSTLGYKLSLLYNTNPDQSVKLYLHGNVLSPSASINTLYGNDKENWIGYWLYQEQSPFDAIDDDVLDELTEIKAQNWFCYKDWYMGQQNPQWICGVGKGVNIPSLNYGDMVILKSNNNISNFQWQSGNKQSFSEIKSATEYYQYEEEADYTAYLIETDTANRPDEIGAFIGNTCIGASKVLSSDTLVLIRGYDTDTTGTVYFVEYFNAQKSSRPAIKEYYVKNNYQNGWQKRTIDAKEKESHYLVSFKPKKIVKSVNNDNSLALKVYPNPARNSITVEYITTGNKNTAIEIFNITGKRIVNRRERQPIGLHSSIINTRNFRNSIYLLRLTTGDQTAVKRFVVDR